jgi:hypothetical protein
MLLLQMSLMSYGEIVRGEVGRVARGINVANAQSDPKGSLP